MSVSETAGVERAVRKFYQAIEEMVTGRGLTLMEQVWDQSSEVTGKHPLGEWCVGWEEVLATWQVAAQFGRPEHAGSRLLSTRVHVYGDIAYATSLFQATPAWGGEKLMCTNIFRKVGDEWKVIHHHADPSAKLAEALEQMALQG